MKTDWDIHDVMLDATRNTELLQRRLEIAEEELPRCAIFLSDGWAEAFRLERERCFPLKELYGFADLDKSDGRERMISFGFVGATPLLALRSSVHLHDHPTDPRIPYMVRQQIETLRTFGIRLFVLTGTADSLDPLGYPVGSVVVVDGLVTSFSGTLPLMECEQLSPDVAISLDLNFRALEGEHRFPVQLGGYVMTRGPHYTGQKYDQRLMRASGAACLGRDILPETAVIALIPDNHALALVHLVAAADENCNFATRQKRARDHSDELAAYLTALVPHL